MIFVLVSLADGKFITFSLKSSYNFFEAALAVKRSNAEISNTTTDDLAVYTTSFIFWNPPNIGFSEVPKLWIHRHSTRIVFMMNWALDLVKVSLYMVFLKKIFFLIHVLLVAPGCLVLHLLSLPEFHLDCGAAASA